MRALRPVGGYVPLFPSEAVGGLPDLTCGGRYVVRFLNSGTAALARALAFSARRKASTGADALLPAYGCPDLIAAAMAVNVNVRLIDIEPDSPWLDLRKIPESLGTAAAIVAVNFLGMRERLEELLEAARARGVPLIEDSAQMAPFSAGSQPTGDLVVYSFGRGKPLTLLSGGALLVRSDWAHELDQLFPPQPVQNDASFAYWAKCIAYNAAIHPFSYAGLRRLPFLALGRLPTGPWTRSRPWTLRLSHACLPPTRGIPNSLGRAARHHGSTAFHRSSGDRSADAPRAQRIPPASLSGVDAGRERPAILRLRASTQPGWAPALSMPGRWSISAAYRASPDKPRPTRGCSPAGC